jgi:hypothetical protein
MFLTGTLFLLMTAAAPPVATHRSDGTGAGVREVPRRVARRDARVVRSTDALAKPGAWRARIEPPGGGVRVAPAGEGGADETAPVIVARPRVTLPSADPAR